MFYLHCKDEKTNKEMVTLPNETNNKAFFYSMLFLQGSTLDNKKEWKPSFNQGKTELSKTSAHYLSICGLQKKKKCLFLCKYIEEFSYAICGMQVKEITFLTALQQGPVYLECIDNR